MVGRRRVGEAHRVGSAAWSKGHCRIDTDTYLHGGLATDGNVAAALKAAVLQRIAGSSPVHPRHGSEPDRWLAGPVSKAGDAKALARSSLVASARLEKW